MVRNQQPNFQKNIRSALTCCCITIYLLWVCGILLLRRHCIRHLYWPQSIERFCSVGLFYYLFSHQKARSVILLHPKVYDDIKLMFIFLFILFLKLLYISALYFILQTAWEELAFICRMLLYISCMTCICGAVSTARPKKR